MAIKTKNEIKTICDTCSHAKVCSLRELTIAYVRQIAVIEKPENAQTITTCNEYSGKR